MAKPRDGIWDGVLRDQDDRYHVYVCVQDGTEHAGEYATEKDARRKWKDAHRTLNHDRYKRKDAPLYVQRITVTTELVRKA